MNRRDIMAGGVAVAASVFAGHALADDLADRAGARVEALVQEVHDALVGSEVADPERDRRIRASVSGAFALELWRRAVIGDVAETVSAQQLEAVDAALPGYMAGLYVDVFAGNAGKKPEVGGARPLRRDVLVDVMMFREGRRPLALEYRVRDFDGDARVIDVIVGGVSFALQKREEFKGILERGGAEALIAFLQERAI